MNRTLRSPRKTPSQTRSSLTVDAIVAAAIRIFEASGYRAATTIKIARRAGVSVGSLYQYFPNKLALLAAVKKHLLARQFARIGRALDNAPDGPAGLREAIRVHLEESYAARRLWLIFADELPARLDTQMVKPSGQPHVTMLRRFFEKHRTAWPNCSPADAALMIGELVDAVTRTSLHERPESLRNGMLETELVAAAEKLLSAP